MTRKISPLAGEAPGPQLRFGVDRELRQALELADRVLDRINADPDDDKAMLARQLIREHEIADKWREGPPSESLRGGPAPDGWQLVPQVVDEKMTAAGWKAQPAGPCCDWDMAGIWDHMRMAAPPPPVQEIGEDEIKEAVSKGANAYWDGGRLQEQAYAKWKREGFSGDCPQVHGGSIIDHITRAVIATLTKLKAATINPKAQSMEDQ